MKIRVMFYRDKQSLKDYSLLNSLVTKDTDFYNLVRQLRDLCIPIDKDLIKSFGKREDIKDYIDSYREKFPAWFKPILDLI
jgi:hypothetical protein